MGTDPAALRALRGQGVEQFRSTEATMKVIIKAEYARLIQPFICTETTRYYLGGFYVERDPVKGVRIVATDGHRMVVFHDETGLCLAGQGAIIALPKEAVRLCKPGNRWEPNVRYVEINLGADTATIHIGDPREASTPVGTFNGVLVDGTFPDYRRVIPELPNPGSRKGRPVVQSYRTAYLADFAKVADGKDASIRLHAYEDGGPAIVFVGGRDDCFGVVMPYRDAQRDRFPQWWTRRPKILRLPAPDTAASTQQAREIAMA
jgi:hypothetical protein